MDFGEAIKAIKEGKKVCRSGWNDKSQYLTLGTKITTTVRQMFKHENSETAAIVFHGTFGTQVGFIPSQPDMLSEDWQIID